MEQRPNRIAGMLDVPAPASDADDERHIESACELGRLVLLRTMRKTLALLNAQIIFEEQRAKIADRREDAR